MLFQSYWLTNFLLFYVPVPIRFWKQLLPHLAQAVSWEQNVVPESLGKSTGTCSESQSCRGSKCVLLVLIYLHCRVYSGLWHPAQPTGYSEDTNLKAGYLETIKNKCQNRCCRHPVAGKSDWNELFKKAIFLPGLWEADRPRTGEFPREQHRGTCVADVTQRVCCQRGAI